MQQLVFKRCYCMLSASKTSYQEFTIGSVSGSCVPIADLTMHMMDIFIVIRSST